MVPLAVVTRAAWWARVRQWWRPGPHDDEWPRWNSRPDPNSPPGLSGPGLEDDVAYIRAQVAGCTRVLALGPGVGRTFAAHDPGADITCYDITPKGLAAEVVRGPGVRAMPLDDDLPVARDVVRHCLATLAYRAAKVLRDVPPDFPEFSVGGPTRRPLLIVAHLADLMAWGVTFTQEKIRWVPGGGGDWDVEVARFFDGLETLDGRLTTVVPSGDRLEKLIQGPIADALWHVGQLAMLRGMAGAPVRPESYARAHITRGRVGRDQPPPVAEFDSDASVRV